MRSQGEEFRYKGLEGLKVEREKGGCFSAVFPGLLRGRRVDSSPSSLNMKKWRSINKSGFTLLELLIVVAILAAVAGGVILALGGVQDDAALNLSRGEMLEIKKAILRFRQDTGFLPKQGPFDLAPPDGTGAVPLPAQGEAWFRSPANLVQLYENPFPTTSTHPLKAWNPDTGRGWRGPYLTRQGEGLVDLGNGLNGDGTGSPTTGTALLSEMPGVADPYAAKPGPCTLGGVPRECFAWRAVAGGIPHDRWGRPYFLFDLNDPAQARIVGVGPNGIYDNGIGDDLVLSLFR